MIVNDTEGICVAKQMLYCQIRMMIEHTFNKVHWISQWNGLILWHIVYIVIDKTVIFNFSVLLWY